MFNLRLWLRDLARIRKLTALRTENPSLDRHRGAAPRVSFLVAAWNAESTIRSCLEAIGRLSYANFEIVLSAGGADLTWKIATECRDLRLILIAQQPGDGKQESLRRCLERARGEIIYLLDAGGRITDAAFARIVAPILRGDEQVVTANPCTPVREQIDNPFAVSQCASQVYTSIYQPEYCTGLLGANCAILRSALEQAGGFNAAVLTGGDYDLGKRLLRQGRRIRYEVDASFPTEFHTDVRPYLRQQARWIRNVVIRGIGYGAYGEVAAGIATSLVGLAMIALPLLSVALAWTSPAAARIFGGVWTVAFLHAYLSRLRYLNVAARWMGLRFSPTMLVTLPLLMFIDFIAWSIPLFQYPSRGWRERW